jgi:integrase
MLPQKQPYICLPQKQYTLNMVAKKNGRLTPSRRTKPWQNFHRAFNRLLERASVPKRDFHDCRKTCATELANEGVAPANLADYLGHESFQTTMNYYRKPNQKKIAEINAIRSQKFLCNE